MLPHAILEPLLDLPFPPTEGLQAKGRFEKQSDLEIVRRRFDKIEQRPGFPEAVRVVLEDLKGDYRRVLEWLRDPGFDTSGLLEEIGRGFVIRAGLLLPSPRHGAPTIQVVQNARPDKVFADVFLQVHHGSLDVSVKVGPYDHPVEGVTCRSRSTIDRRADWIHYGKKGLELAQVSAGTNLVLERSSSRNDEWFVTHNNGHAKMPFYYATWR